MPALHHSRNGVGAHATFMARSWIGVLTAGLAQLANRQRPEESPWPVPVSLVEDRREDNRWRVPHTAEPATHDTGQQRRQPWTQSGRTVHGGLSYSGS